MFDHLFRTFKPCVDAFNHVKLMIQVDGTFLYEKYKGILLIATSQDGDTNIVPLVFSIVGGETYKAWSWFLYNV